MFFIKLLLRLLYGYAPKTFEGINEEVRDEWLISLVLSEGFKSYFKYRDLQILKSVANGVDQQTYWQLMGHRAELLFLAGESKRLFDKTEKESKKKMA